MTKKQPEGEPDVAPPEAASSDAASDDLVDEPAQASGEPFPEDAAEDRADRADQADQADRADQTDRAGQTDRAEDVAEGLEDRLARAERALAERTLDLQRLQAEYLNYKRRVDRDRELVRENATFAALAPIVEVLDTIDRARDHGDLDPGFRAVADQLERVVTDAGLVRYGEPGDPFDPRLHEALSHIGQDPEVEVTTAKVIAKAGYRIGDRVVRVAQVLVVDPPQA